MNSEQMRQSLRRSVLYGGLRIESVKAFGNEQWAEFKPLTLVYGPNSAGKSTILQLIRWFADSAEFRDLSNTESWIHTPVLPLRTQSCDFGSFRNFVHRHDVDSNPKIEFRFNTNRTIPRPTGFYLSAPEWEIGLTLGAMERADISACTLKRIDIEHGALEQMRSIDSMPPHPDRDTQFALRKINIDFCYVNMPWSFDWSDEDYVSQFGTKESVIPDSWFIHTDSVSFLKEYFAGDEIVDVRSDAEWALVAKHLRFVPQGHLGPFLPVLVADNQIKTLWRLRSHTPSTSADEPPIDEPGQVDALELKPTPVVQTLPALRDFPSRIQAARESEGTKTMHREQLGARSAGNAWLALAEQPALLEKFNQTLSALDIPYQAKVRYFEDPSLSGYFQVRLRDLRTGATATPADVGFGVSQVAPIIAAALGGRSETLLVEQPELHLHPRLQGTLADLFIENLEAPFCNQWIIETHSEALMSRIQRRIREGTLSADSVSVLYVEEACAERPYSQIIQLRLNADGDFIDRWPRGFFDDRMLDVLI
jgi:hypothetical protein